MCVSNLSTLLAGSVYKEALNLGYGVVTDDCGDDFTKIGIHTFTRELNILDFGADRTGVADSTSAFEDAMAELPLGGTIIIPEGLYAVNLVLTGGGYNFIGQQSDNENASTACLIPFDPTLPVVKFGDGTTNTRSIRLRNVTIRPKTGVSADKGVMFYGCNRCYLIDCVVRNFEDYQIQFDSSATKPTFFIHVIGCSISEIGVSGCLGIDFNYGAQYTSGIFLADCDINGIALGSYVIDLEANCLLNIQNTWIEAGNNRGIHFAASSSKIRGTNVIVDSSASSDVLITCDFDATLPNIISGTITIDGLAAVTSGNTAALSGRYFVPFEAILSWPSIQGHLEFQDTAAAVNLQHATGIDNQKIYRSGTTLISQSVDGNIQFRPISGGLVDVFTGALQIRENAVAGNANCVVFGKQVQTTVGAAGAATALPAQPTGYLRFFIGSTEYVLPYYARA